MTPTHAVHIAALIVVGAVVGGWLDRLIRRLPLERSPIWPWRNHCSRCFAPAPRSRSLPIIGAFVGRGRCPSCGHRLDGRPLLMQFLMAAGLVALYWLRIMPSAAKDLLPQTRIVTGIHSFSEWDYWLLFTYHSVLLAFLLVATFIDFDYMIIPDSVTIPGMIVGVAGSTLMFAMHPIPFIADSSIPPPEYFDSRVWDQLWMGRPEWLENIRETLRTWWLTNDRFNFGTPLLSSLCGLVVGGLLVWSIRAVSSLAFGRETLGLGDVTLMMLIGAFIGWQTVILAFFISPISASLLGVVRWILTGRADLPYGPHLSLAAFTCLFIWRPLWAASRDLFLQSSLFLGAAAVLLLVAMLVVSIALRIVKGIFALLLGTRSAAK